MEYAGTIFGHAGDFAADYRHFDGGVARAASSGSSVAVSISAWREAARKKIISLFATPPYQAEQPLRLLRLLEPPIDDATSEFLSAAPAASAPAWAHAFSSSLQDVATTVLQRFRRGRIASAVAPGARAALAAAITSTRCRRQFEATFAMPFLCAANEASRRGALPASPQRER